MSYAVKEIFLTLQGEGTHTGRRAVFVRFAGCNVWSGREQDRARDAEKGTCARWCDTQFFGIDGTSGGRYTAPDLVRVVLETWASAEAPFVVLTGGEPALQVDDELINLLHAMRPRPYIAIETNGSLALHDGSDWVCCSPKPPKPVVLTRVDEIKCVVPAVNPLDYQHLADRRYVSPLDEGGQHTSEAVHFVMENPTWRLSLQTHKILGLR